MFLASTTIPAVLLALCAASATDVRDCIASQAAAADAFDQAPRVEVATATRILGPGADGHPITTAEVHACLHADGDTRLLRLCEDSGFLRESFRAEGRDAWRHLIWEPGKEAHSIRSTTPRLGREWTPQQYFVLAKAVLDFPDAEVAMVDDSTLQVSGSHQGSDWMNTFRQVDGKWVMTAAQGSREDGLHGGTQFSDVVELPGGALFPTRRGGFNEAADGDVVNGGADEYHHWRTICDEELAELRSLGPWELFDRLVAEADGGASSAGE